MSHATCGALYFLLGTLLFSCDVIICPVRTHNALINVMPYYNRYGLRVGKCCATEFPQHSGDLSSLKKFTKTAKVCAFIVFLVKSQVLATTFILESTFLDQCHMDLTNSLLAPVSPGFVSRDMFQICISIRWGIYYFSAMQIPIFPHISPYLW